MDIEERVGRCLSSLRSHVAEMSSWQRERRAQEAWQIAAGLPPGETADYWYRRADVYADVHMEKGVMT